MTSSKSASSTPLETKRGAQCEIADWTFVFFHNLAQRLEDPLGRERHRGDARVERRERVVDRVHDRGRRAGGAGLADALGAELRLLRRRLDVRADDVGHLARHRHEVVGHVAVQELAVGAVEAFLVERGADALHDAAAQLLVDQHRVDHRARVLDAPVLEQPDEAGVGIDLDQRGLDAVGEGEAVLARRVVARDGELGLEIHRQRVGPEVRDAAELGERQLRLQRQLVDHLRCSAMSSSALSIFRIAAATSRMLARSARPACSTASPPMPAPREAHVPPP